MESILVIVLLLATHAAAGTTAGEQPKRGDSCQSTGFAREINSYCRESVIAFVDVEGSGTAPGPCRVAAQPQLIMAGLNTAGLLASFASCRALALGGTPLQAACEGDQLATGKETGRLPGMGTNMYPSSALLGQTKDEPMADLPVDDLTEKHDGTIMAVSKDHVKPSPLPDSWNLAEIFTTGAVLHGYLTIMTAIFFWAAYKTTKFPRVFHVKSLEKTAQDDFQMLASAVYLQVSTISQALIFVTRWQEFRFNSIFSMSEQRSDPHVSVYNLSRNHDIGYSSFHSVRREGLPRFIITIILLGVLFSAIRPIQAAAPIINVELKFDPEGYVGWSHDLYTVGTSLSQLEFTSTRQKVLGQQTLPQEPPAWIHVNVSDATEWSKFIMRSDNYYLSAYENREATHSFEEAAGFFPGSIDFGVSGSYSSLNGGRRNLTNLNLNMDSAKLALLILSRYKHGVSDPFLMKRALTIYELILGEGQRFTEVDTCIKDGWNSDCYLTRPHDLLVNWGILSCGILEGWEPNPRHADWWVRSRKETYRKALNNLKITEAQAAGLLRVLVIGKACEDNIKGVHCITGNDSSCSIRA